MLPRHRRHRTGELVVTSAGNSGQAWWAATRDTEASFYLDASMSLSTMFASGWRWRGPNEGLGLHGRWRVLHKSRHADGGAPDEPAEPHPFPGLQPRYGATSNADLPNLEKNDYAAIARGMGLERVFKFRQLEPWSAIRGVLGRNAPGHTFVVLEVEPFSERSRSCSSRRSTGPS